MLVPVEIPGKYSDGIETIRVQWDVFPESLVEIRS